ncbi:MAG: hypothetical protein NXI31_04465 [bacterium]|nr:hypothetical protein [bacterium]
MAIPRRNYGRTAILLAICGVGIGIWLFGEGESAAPRDLEPARTPGPATDRIDSARGTIEESANPDRHGDAAPSTKPGATDSATVEVELTCESPNEIRTLAIDAFTSHGTAVVAHAIGRPIATGAIATLEIAPLTWHRIQVTADDGIVLSRRLRLGNGEHHRILVPCPPRTAEIQVVGPSPELLPHLQLDITDRGQPDTPAIRTGLDESGACRVRIVGPAVARIRTTRRTAVAAVTTDGRREFEPGSEPVRLTPREPLLGVVVQASGEALPAMVHLDPRQVHYDVERAPADRAACTVFRRERAERATRIAISTAAGGRQFADPQSAKQAADVWTFSIYDLTNVGELRVRFEGDITDEGTSQRAQLWVQSQASDDRQRLAPAPDRDGYVAYLPVGDYRLFWLPTPGREETAVDFVRIAASEPTELELAPRELQRWQIRFPAAPAGVMLDLEWPAESHAGSSDAGRFEADLGRIPRVGERATIRLDHQEREFVAEFTSVDTANRHATITSALTKADAVTINVEPLEHGGDPDLRLADASLGSTRVWLLPGDRLRLHSTEIVDDQRQMLGWFDVTPGQPEVTLRPRGRWATMRFERDRGSARVVHVGADSETVELKLRPTTTPFRFFVADGTTAIHVEVDSVRQTFGTNLAEFVVR